MPRVLSIGQCGFDSASLERLFRQSYAAEVESVDSGDEARGLLRGSQFDLVLVNRRLDRDGSSGIDLIAQLLEDAPSVPVMLVSDRADAQAEAVEKGATPGFGKSALGSPETDRRIRAVLGGK